MNGNHRLEAHYTNTGYPYVVDGFVGNYQDRTQAPQPQYAYDGVVHDQDAAYWSTNMSSYRYGLSSQPSTSYYGLYEADHFLPHMDQSVRLWEYPTMMTIEDPIIIDAPSGANRIRNIDSIPDESAGSRNHQEGDNSEVAWQDNIDLDGMTYEELLDLGEAIGTESRGLSEELISLLPISKYKSGGLFSRKRSGERCVICQTRYKRGDRQISLPCKHVYHTDCGSKWLSINKTCPVCNADVFGDESKQ
ncbi:hypothetical protein LIER_18842 [Lithospermum erythrorhizon]|uniref:RING-type domain-containing protein n=1 Tax=Lithospermum erythrorhizon TaxID=34254 RepID=A0AAV3QIM1_LITER